MKLSRLTLRFTRIPGAGDRRGVLKRGHGMRFLNVFQPRIAQLKGYNWGPVCSRTHLMKSPTGHLELLTSESCHLITINKSQWSRFLFSFPEPSPVTSTWSQQRHVPRHWSLRCVQVAWQKTRALYVVSGVFFPANTTWHLARLLSKQQQCFNYAEMVVCNPTRPFVHTFPEHRTRNASLREKNDHSWLWSDPVLLPYFRWFFSVTEATSDSDERVFQKQLAMLNFFLWWKLSSGFNWFERERACW